MSKSLECYKKVSDIKKSCPSLKNKHRVLKSKENIFKSKCDKELRKRLRKYKLRRDGIEDPDILDVSKILSISLKIKSPNNQDKVSLNNNIIENNGIEPENYIIRMVRRKKPCFNDGVRKNENDTENESLLSNPAEEIDDKKNMDAFKLMMDARNKSIGTNSPGKARVESPESIETAEKKEIKAKRLLSLQKMALSKGSLKNKEIEDLRDRNIKKKMIKRSERLKDMINKNDIKGDIKLNETHLESLNVSVTDITIKPERSKPLKLSEIFNDTVEIIDHPKKNDIPLEDIEFLNKLSPSLKKKENMLNYFKKVEKDDSLGDSQNPVIKVKLNTKLKKNKKGRKISENGQYLPGNEGYHVVTSDSKDFQVNSLKRCKRKRNINVGNHLPSETAHSTELATCENRPKRNVKKPVKYSDDIQLFSSDEELHIFTPKKKKNTVKSKVDMEALKDSKGLSSLKAKGLVENKIECKNKVSFNNKSLKCINHDSNLLSNSMNVKKVKLAPIFVTKTQLSPADLEAKKNFLKSGVPEKLKKKMPKKSNAATYDNFHSVVHIQQNKPTIVLNGGKDWYDFTNQHKISYQQFQCPFKSFLILKELNDFNVPIVPKQKPEITLKGIKCAYPKFPVYRTYHLLRGKSKGEFKDIPYPDLDNSVEIMNGQVVDTSNENPDQLNWCDKYKPTSSKQIIGNFERIKELKRWLEAWTENLFKTKQNTIDDSDFSDFYNSDTDSRDSIKNINNLLILTGKTGSGKTSSVYAVASELSIKVIEVNASSKRTGKIMLQDLQEATQSHKVDRGRSGSDNSQNHQEEISENSKRCSRPKKMFDKKKTGIAKILQSNVDMSGICQPQLPESQDSISSVRTGISLILIDDADIVFEQDDGFCSAITQLIQSSKRPVIMVTSSVSCPHLQKFLQIGKTLHMQPVLSRMFGTWLDVMCLADMGECYSGLGAKVLDYFNGDIRKTINCLQFYMNSSKHSQGDEVALSHFKAIDDEDSSMSWIDGEVVEIPMSNDIELQLSSYSDKQVQLLQLGSPMNIFNVWWNILGYYVNTHAGVEMNMESNQGVTSINGIANILDTISLADYFGYNTSTTSTDITVSPWHLSEYPSLYENENFEVYDKSTFIIKDISHTLISSTIDIAQKLLKKENDMSLMKPTMSVTRNRDKLVSRHHKLSSYLNPSIVLDRRATALDYWPMCRSICRIERNKPDANMKRNNRFCHYLKSLSILGKNDYFDSLADSLT